MDFSHHYLTRVYYAVDQQHLKKPEVFNTQAHKNDISLFVHLSNVDRYVIMCMCHLK